MPVVVSVTRAQAGKGCFRVPAWSKTFTVNGKPAAAVKGWCEVEAPAGASAWSLTMKRGVEERTFAVSDYASLSNIDDKRV